MERYTQISYSLPLSSIRQHPDINDCLENNREDYIHICTFKWRVLTILGLGLGLAHFCVFVQVRVCVSLM